MEDTTATHGSLKGNELKAKFSILTNAELHHEEDINGEILRKVQVKLGKTRDGRASIISALPICLN